jgi:hypothetical protein
MMLRDAVESERKYVEMPQNCWGSGLCPSSGILKKVKLQLQTLDKVQNPSNYECYTPSTEPFTFCGDAY